MRKLLLAIGLLGSLIAQAQTMSSTQFGLAKAGNGLTVDANGFLNVNNSNSGSSSTLPYTIVSTAGGLQAAWDNAAPGTTLICISSMTYTAPQTINLTQKNGITIEGNGSYLDGGTANHLLLKINRTKNLSIKNWNLRSQHTGNLYSLMLVNEEGPVEDFLLDNVTFSCPNGDYNAFSALGWSEQGNTGTFHKNWWFNNLRGFKLNRMFAEFLSHKWDGVARFSNIHLTNCFVNDSGLLSSDGMAYSFSGDIENVTLDICKAYGFRGYAAEFIGTQRFSATGCVFVTSKRFGGSGGSDYGSNGFNMTDGYNTQNGNPGRGAKGGSITGGLIDVSGRPIQTSYAQQVAINGGRWIGGDASLLQHSSAFDIKAVSIRTNKNYCFYFDDSSYNTIDGGSYDNYQAQDPYEWVGFYSGSTNNVVYNIRLLGSSVNNKQIASDNPQGNNRYINVYYNGNFISGIADNNPH